MTPSDWHPPRASRPIEQKCFLTYKDKGWLLRVFSDP